MSEDEVRSRLAGVEGWKREGNVITWERAFGSFEKAIAFINQVADLAKEANHHPDIYNSWRTVTLALTTHDAGGLTERDFRLAHRINELPTE
ncbi:MAG: 4a-hydroxytetrahydrobiopterin dehydratase [Thermoplasmata archaeon]|nr:4a-hydroxytetrahydrobiopterin dehydratase [Thermoplasmata archaeon]